VSGCQRFFVLSPICLWVPSIAGQDQFLRFDASFDNCFGRISVRECHLVPYCFEVLVLCSPAEQTLLCAVERCRRHLYTLVRFYAIESLFVARSSFGQCFMEPSASFYGRVLAHEMVFCLFKASTRTVGATGSMVLSHLRRVVI